MTFISNGIDVDVLPDTACCKEDPERRNPLDLPACPFGHDVCDGDCCYYSEDESDKKLRELMIELPGNAGYFYHPTDMLSAKKALQEVFEKYPWLDWSNVKLERLVLMDREQTVVDVYP